MVLFQLMIFFDQFYIVVRQILHFLNILVWIYAINSKSYSTRAIFLNFSNFSIFSLIKIILSIRYKTILNWNLWHSFVELHSFVEFCICQSRTNLEITITFQNVLTVRVTFSHRIVYVTFWSSNSSFKRWEWEYRILWLNVSFRNYLPP